MTALSTHDTKRSEDVRARITALAEVPGEWEATLDRAPAARADARRRASANLLWQAVVGAWPISRGADPRVRREGDARGRRAHHLDRPRRRSSRAAVHAALDAAYDDDARHARSLEAIVARIEPAGRSNALAAKLLALTMPGVPDVYQGTELGDLSLVDPDNRRPVDFDAAAASLGDGSNDEAGAHRRGAAAAARPARAVHVVRRRAGRGPGRRPRARLRPGWRDHRRHPAAGRARGQGRLGRHRAAAARRARSRRRDPLRARRPRSWCTDEPRALRRLGAVPEAGPAVGRRRGRRDDAAAPTAGGRRSAPVPGRRGRLRLPARRRRAGRCPTRGRVASPHGVHERSRTFDPTAFEWTDEHWTGRQLAGAVLYELHLGTFTPEGTLDAAIDRLDHLVDARRRPRRAAAGQRLQRHPQLGLRRRAVVRRPRGVRRPGGLPALRRRRPRRRARRGAGRRLQPPRPVRELPAAVRALPEERGREHLGRRWSTSTARGRRRYAASSSTTP